MIPSQRSSLSSIKLLPGALASLVALAACSDHDSRGAPVVSADAGAAETLEAVALQRGLDPDEARAALETRVAPGAYDEFTMLTSGGHSGSIYLIGIPSLRILKEIPVYAPNSWQGWGQGSEEGQALFAEGTFAKDLHGLPTQSWGDLHHPQISLTNGDYDGDFVFATDKTAGRAAVVDLRDFKTKQIVKIPNTVSDHSGVLTDNSEYFVVTTFQPSPGGPGAYAPLEQYADKYRGAMTFLAFDREKGRFDMELSWQMELPPYWQDLSVLGRGDHDDVAFCNSMNTEMSTGRSAADAPPMEIGASLNEMDYLHVVLWHDAETLVDSDSPLVIEKNGIQVIPLDVARDKGLLYLVPQSKSPHGCDLSPGGEYVLTAGKLDPHVTAYSVDKIKQAIREKNFEKRDRYGIPVLSYDGCVAAHVELGLGPLHTVFDDKGNGYTSLFLDCAVAKFTLGPPYHTGDEAWKLVDKCTIHYNIGHLQTPGSNTVKPRGRYLAALNKWTVDRHPGSGPLHPQNLQLIDVSGPKMRVVNEAPIIGEPHNSQIIETDRIAAWRVYPPATDPMTMRRSEHATQQGEEGIERTADGVHVRMVAIRSHYKPDTIHVKQGDHVVIDITNAESAEDATHGFGLAGYNVTASIDPGAVQRIEFTAAEAGVYPFYCTEFCSALHMEMTGWLLVEPAAD